MTIKKKLACIDCEFEKNARKAFPYHKSMYSITKQLNNILEELIYEQKKNWKKR